MLWIVIANNEIVGRFHTKGKAIICMIDFLFNSTAKDVHIKHMTIEEYKNFYTNIY